MKIILKPYSNEWENWFAWYPVFLSTGQIIWLETVQRKKKFTDDGDYWVYREKIND